MQIGISSCRSGLHFPTSNSFNEKDINESPNSSCSYTFRRCVQCSGAHCCNSWCKEEAIFVQLFLALAVSQSIVYLPTLDALATKLNLDRAIFTQLANDFFVGRPEVSRAAEMAVGGLVLPILCYFWLPTYRFDFFSFTYACMPSKAKGNEKIG